MFFLIHLNLHSSLKCNFLNVFHIPGRNDDKIIYKSESASSCFKSALCVCVCDMSNKEV